MYAPLQLRSDRRTGQEPEEEVPRVLLRLQRPVCLLERLEGRVGARASDYPEVAVDVVRRGQLPHVRRVVGRVQRREHTLRDLAACRTEVGDEARGGRPREAVVVHDHRGVSPTPLLVEDLADAGVPLRAVSEVAEHVLRSDLHRRVLRSGGADDDGLVEVALGPVGRGDRLVARQRADHHVGVLLHHQPPDLFEDRSGRVVAARVVGERQPGAAGATADNPGRGLVLVLRSGAGELRERRIRAADVQLIAKRKRALAVGKDGDLHLTRLSRRCRRRLRHGCDPSHH